MPLNKPANLDPNESLQSTTNNPDLLDSSTMIYGKEVESDMHSRYLCKYLTDSDLTESIFKDHAFWFSNPQSFNDPFDCNLSEASPYSNEEVTQFLEKYLSQENFAKYKASPSLMSAAEVEEILANYRNQVFAITGILCLSKNYDSILMWSHYTNSHKGLVIELDPIQDLAFFRPNIDVNYVGNYEPTNLLRDRRAYLDQTISTKSNCWAYEDEVRVFSLGHVGKVKINPKAIRRVIFGCKSEAEFIERIRALCSTPELQHVTFAQKKLAYAKFALELCDLKA